MQQPFELDTRALQHAFCPAIKRTPPAAIYRELAQRLNDRLDYFTLVPQDVLLVSQVPNHLQPLIQQRYPAATIQYCSLLKNPPTNLRSFDLIVSDMVLHWVVDIQQTLANYQYLLKPEGLLLFSTVGPDTLHELNLSFTTRDHVHPFYDMHDIGDLLKHLQFVDPVMDIQRLTLVYASVKQLCLDLKASGVTNKSLQRSRGLMGKASWQTMLQNYEKYRNSSGLLPATFELITGSAFYVMQQQQKQNEVTVPIESLFK